MINIKSNIRNVRKSFQKYVSQFNNKLNKAIEYITATFYEEIVKNVNQCLPDPVRDSALSNDIEVDDYSFMYDIVIEKVNDLYYKIKLGENSGRKAKDGSIVNPFYYYEFGFGFVGLGGFDNYDKAFEFGWDYDVNNHGSAGWNYKINGQTYWTSGLNGLGFLQKTIDWYKENKEQILKDAIKKAGL